MRFFNGSKIAVIAIAVTAALVSLPVHAAAPAPAVSATAEEASVIQQTNAVRTKAGLPELKEDAALDLLADLRAEECAQKFSHTRPDGTAWYTLGIEQGMDILYGENLAEGYSFAEVVPAWEASPGHMANIVGQYGTIGVGSYTDPATGITYFVQEYGM